MNSYTPRHPLLLIEGASERKRWGRERGPEGGSEGGQAGREGGRAGWEVFLLAKSIGMKALKKNT